jgi:shikimate dehydrogenase
VADRHAAVIGHPIAHSLSPALFAEFARAAGIDLDYRAVDVPPDALATTLAGWRTDEDFVGCNVTMPHKERIIALLDACTDAARTTAAVNVVRRDGERLIGDNTDVAGIATTLAGLGFAPRGRNAIVFGAGGAARAVVWVLGEGGAATVSILARSLERAHSLARDATAKWPRTTFDAHELGTHLVRIADIYVNATPLGQSGAPNQELLPGNAPQSSCAFDLVYRPAQTPFLAEARQRGLRAAGGFTMLLEQALATFESWFGFRPRIDDAARKRLEQLAA